MKAVAMALALAERGVVWRIREGAHCPLCGKRMLVHNKQDAVRYCRCRASGCLVRQLGLSVKAVPENA